MLKRIRYVSLFAAPVTGLDLDELVAISARNNAALDITGILMASGEVFYQIIEGPTENVEQLYRRIVFDPRHRDVILLSEENDVPERLFPRWCMKKMDLGAEAAERLEPIREMVSDIVEQKLRIERMINTVERGIWRELKDRT